jgi:protein gp37
MAKRLKGMGQAKYQNDGDPRTSGPGFGLTVHPDTLDAPLHWRKPQMVFVNSMSDLFHPKVPTTFIASVFDVMARAGALAKIGVSAAQLSAQSGRA